MVTCLKRITLSITSKIPDKEFTFKKQACSAYDRIFSVDIPQPEKHQVNSGNSLTVAVTESLHKVPGIPS